MTYAEVSPHHDFAIDLSSSNGYDTAPAIQLWKETDSRKFVS